MDAQERFLSPENIEEITALIEYLQEMATGLREELIAAEEESRYQIELEPDNYTAKHNGRSAMRIRQFQARPMVRQTVVNHHLQLLQERAKRLQQMLENALAVLNMRMMQRAQQIHEALREASKTDPSLLDAVRELDELARQTEEEDAEDADQEETGSK